VIEALQKLVPWIATLSTAPKVALSLVAVALAAFMLAVIWVPQSSLAGGGKPANGGKPMWPADKSLEGLRRKLDRISETNAKIVAVVGNSGRYGVYVDALSSDLGLPRDEVVYRLKELERDGLVEVLALTDLNARLNEEVAQLLGGNAGQFLSAYLK
jgi:DNA-binding transcriptional ArsR family regulator